jgi:hypothetical protein
VNESLAARPAWPTRQASRHSAQGDAPPRWIHGTRARRLVRACGAHPGARAQGPSIKSTALDLQQERTLSRPSYPTLIRALHSPAAHALASRAEASLSQVAPKLRSRKSRRSFALVSRAEASLSQVAPKRGCRSSATRLHEPHPSRRAKDVRASAAQDGERLPPQTKSPCGSTISRRSQIRRSLRFKLLGL